MPQPYVADAAGSYDHLRAEAENPATSAERLSELAAYDPRLLIFIRQNPACYAELAAWIDEQVVPAYPQVAPPDPTPLQMAAPLASVPQEFAAETTVAESQPQVSSPEMPASDRTAGSVAKWIWLGIGIGAIVGAALSAIAVLIVLPGLFGGVLG